MILSEAWVLTGAPGLAGTEKNPTPTISCHMWVQIRDSNTLVKPAGIRAYVSLPSTCIRVLTFPSVHTALSIRTVCHCRISSCCRSKAIMVISMEKGIQEAINDALHLGVYTDLNRKKTTTTDKSL